MIEKRKCELLERDEDDDFFFISSMVAETSSVIEIAVRNKGGKRS
jgi:hypothetical protein